MSSGSWESSTWRFLKATRGSKGDLLMVMKGIASVSTALFQTGNVCLNVQPRNVAKCCMCEEIVVLSYDRDG